MPSQASRQADVVIVGGGQAGAGTALALREFGYAGSVLLVSAESVLPYERPPLSKDFLLGRRQADTIAIASAAHYAERDIQILLNADAQALDVERARLRLADGRVVSYKALVLATGARLRRLRVPGSDAAPIHYLRALSDARALQAALAPQRRLVVVGGGFIGLEVASAARCLDCTVTVIEAGSRLMARAIAPFVSDYFRRLHESQGVEVRLDTSLRRIDAGPGGSCLLTLEHGDVLPAEVLVAGIGVDPETSLAAEAGLAVDDGILVDEQGRTSAADVYACGDAARPRTGMRRETWQHAVESARRVAASICGRLPTAHEVPWFWSDQAGVNFQMAGASSGWSDIVVRGDIGSDRFSAFLLQDARVIAVNTINNGREMRTGRKWIAEGAKVDGTKLRDTAVRLEACEA